MKNISEFDSFNLNDPHKGSEKKYVLSSVTLKSDFFSMLSKDEKAIIKPLIGKEIDVILNPKDDSRYVLKTSNKKYPEIQIPKRLVYC